MVGAGTAAEEGLEDAVAVGVAFAVVKGGTDDGVMDWGASGACAGGLLGAGVEGVHEVDGEAGEVVLDGKHEGGELLGGAWGGADAAGQLVAVGVNALEEAVVEGV